MYIYIFTSSHCLSIYIYTYDSSLIVGRLDCIRCPHRANVFAGRQKLVHLLVGIFKGISFMCSPLLMAGMCCSSLLDDF